MPRKRTLYYSAAAIIVILLVWSLDYYYGDHTRSFLENRRTITDVDERTSADSAGYVLKTIHLTGSSSLNLECFLRIPKTVPGKKLPAIILIGGLRTGRKSVQLVDTIPEADSVIFVGMDYPYNGKMKFSGIDMLPAIPKIRRSLFDTVSSILVLADYLESHPLVDSRRIHLCGVSLGALFVPAAGALDHRFKSVSILYGGADLRKMLLANMNTGNTLLDRIAGETGAFLIRPFEPADYIGRISPRPVIIINGSKDERIPLPCRRELIDSAGEPKFVQNLDTGHIHPKNAALVRLLTRTMARLLIKNNIL